MNLLLLFESDFVSSNRVCLTDRRFLHLHSILKVKQGQSLTAGLLNGKIGQAIVGCVTDKKIELDVQFFLDPPKALPLTLILALPRPQMLKRTLLCVSSMGVKKIIFLNFNRVEKSLWSSSALESETVKEQLILGLEQGKDTLMPEVILKKGFKAFVEDELEGLIKGKSAFVAHPGESAQLARIHTEQAVLIIGPEGGLLNYEIDALKAKGVKSVHLGERILRFENAIPYAIGKMF